MDIYVSGSLAIDRIMNFPGKFQDHILPEKIHILNVCFLVNGLEERFGGTAGNIAYSLALLEEKPHILSTAGKDFNAYKEWLTKHGLSLDSIRFVDDDFTASAYITTDMGDNQITGFNPAAMNNPCGFDFSGLDAANSVGIVSPGNLEDMMNFPAEYRKLGLPYIFDPGQNTTAFSAEQLLSAIDGSAMLTTNDYELELIMNGTGLDEAGLLTKTKMLVTTLGEKGCRVTTADSVLEVPAVKASTVADPTGAGDAFRAGLLKGLSLGANMETCCRLGATIASFCVERKGTQEHTFTKVDFIRRYEDAFGTCPF
ncbi:MAG: carbohydrate kinase family protein [Proteobacteria bacterium]|nr:carbohydrate kinase family protein [Pseudomonadota bacterium]MBU1610810.1 carbohydrate kinase family protein [Pseudomonadota bacterium]